MRECLKKLGISVEPDITESFIPRWQAWHRGKVGSFHSYSQYNGKKKVLRSRATLGMAKKVCEEWSNLILSEKVSVGCGDDLTTKKVRSVLEDNAFSVNANRLIEISFALGTGAFVEFKEGGRIRIDYVPAYMIYPISWDNASVLECAFGSRKNIGGKDCLYIQLHLSEEGTYVIKNFIFDHKTKKELPLPEGLMPCVYTGSSVPFFQIITPNIINSINPESPLGVSVFANAIDVLKGIDLVYDSYQNEFRLGKKRIVVPMGMAQLECEKTGLMPVFDDNDTEFYAFSDKSLTELKEINMEIRASEHTEGLQQNLNLLSSLCGLGKERFSMKDGAVKTATEVISGESALYQNLRKHRILIEKGIVALVRAILVLLGEDFESFDISVDFGDGIISDTNTEFKHNLELVSMGIMKPYEFRMWWFNESREQANEKLGSCQD